MKNYEYSASTSILWTSFDYGIVQAENIEEARLKALALLHRDFRKANMALGSIGASIGFNEYKVVVKETTQVCDNPSTFWVILDYMERPVTKRLFGSEEEIDEFIAKYKLDPSLLLIAKM